MEPFIISQHPCIDQELLPHDLLAALPSALIHQLHAAHAIVLNAFAKQAQELEAELADSKIASQALERRCSSLEEQLAVQQQRVRCE